ncbi:transketolase [Undibacterium sp. RuRC25W]|uniref:transketolase n=1 Tax=Undibacterium sp. RuRC25W TaxID=3413047 RepID=UPI003BF41C0B
MRNAACSAWRNLFNEHKFAFLTGDLGFMALEPLRDLMGPWFINAGVAEQNMVSAAAGMCKMGTEAWVYSIAPFIYARPFEQIRNDVCLNRLPVKIVGNGGGYAYGSMGSSHHAIEDYGVLLGLQGMQVFVPAFAEDVEPAVCQMSASGQPGYLRLGRCEKPADMAVPPFSAWRCLSEGDQGVMIVVGPVAGSLMQRMRDLPQDNRPALWALGVMPEGFTNVPDQLLQTIKNNGLLTVVEEHVAHGSAGHALLSTLAQQGVTPKLLHCCAQGYPSGTYGSQVFHRLESQMDADNVLRRWQQESMCL